MENVGPWNRITYIPHRALSLVWFGANGPRLLQLLLRKSPWMEKGSRGFSVSAKEKTFHRADCGFSLNNLVALEADRTAPITTCLGLAFTEWSVFRRVIKYLLATKRVHSFLTKGAAGDFCP